MPTRIIARVHEISGVETFLEEIDQFKQQSGSSTNMVCGMTSMKLSTKAGLLWLRPRLGQVWR